MLNIGKHRFGIIRQTDIIRINYLGESHKTEHSGSITEIRAFGPSKKTNIKKQEPFEKDNLGEILEPDRISETQMVLIPAENFRTKNLIEEQVHTVYADAFYMDIYESSWQSLPMGFSPSPASQHLALRINGHFIIGYPQIESIYTHQFTVDLTIYCLGSPIDRQPYRFDNRVAVS